MKVVTKVLMGLWTIAIGFALSPVGQQIIQSNRYLAAIAVLAGGIASLIHNPIKE